MTAKHILQTSGQLQVEQLVFLLLCGERLAASVSEAQAHYFRDKDKKLAHFLKAQSRQERFHISVFYAALKWINPRSAFLTRKHPIFEQLRHEILESLDHDNPDESILGLQVIVETLGECCIQDLDKTMDRYRMGLEKIRHIILHQEKAHHAFGERYFRSRSLSPEESSQLREAGDRFVSLVSKLLGEIEPVLNHFRIAPQTYLERIEAAMHRSLGKIN